MARAEAGDKDGAPAHLVVFVLDECGLKNHPSPASSTARPRWHVTFVFFEGMRELLPLGCDRVVTLAADRPSGTIVDAHDQSRTADFAYEVVGERAAADFARTLAPVYCEEISLEGTLTRSITFFQLMGIIAADDLDLARRWAQSDVTRSLAAPIGVSKTRTVTLDLHDKADGPHGLVAGTTGSGKSEVLLTYILSVATLFSPHEVSFVIIDFKGGAWPTSCGGCRTCSARSPTSTGARSSAPSSPSRPSCAAASASLPRRASTTSAATSASTRPARWRCRCRTWCSWWTSLPSSRPSSPSSWAS